MRRLLILQLKTLIFHFISVHLLLFQFCHLLRSCVYRVKIWILFSLLFLKEREHNTKLLIASELWFLKLNTIRKKCKERAPFIIGKVYTEICGTSSISAHVIGASGGMGGQETLGKIIAGTFLNLMKKMNLHVQELQ